MENVHNKVTFYEACSNLSQNLSKVNGYKIYESGNQKATARSELNFRCLRIFAQEVMKQPGLSDKKVLSKNATFS